MSVFEIIAAAFLGITLFVLDVAMMYGMFVCWQEKKRIAAVVFFLIGASLTTAYMVTVINMVYR